MVNHGMGSRMTADPRPPRDDDSRDIRGAGAPIALLIIAGAVIGGLFGQATIGLLAGLALGIVIAVLLWRGGRRK
jgi:hypothetical protein